MNESKKKILWAQLQGLNEDEALIIMRKHTTRSGSKSKLNPREASVMWERLTGELEPPFHFLADEGRHKKRSKTDEDKAYHDLVASLGCIVCRRQYGQKHVPAHIHHLRENVGLAQRADERDVIPLCPDHHQHGGYGVAYHAGAKAFTENFGTELELLAATRELIKQLQVRRELNT